MRDSTESCNHKERVSKHNFIYNAYDNIAFWAITIYCEYSLLNTLKIYYLLLIDTRVGKNGSEK